MKIIVIKGRGNCGKSETLGVHLRGMLHEMMSSPLERTFGKDSRETIILKNKVIDICPPGDTEQIVRDNITFFEAHPCDIAFTATRSRGRGCWALEEYANQVGAELVWIQKGYNDNLNKQGQAEMNSTLAEKLLKML